MFRIVIRRSLSLCVSCACRRVYVYVSCHHLPGSPAQIGSEPVDGKNERGAHEGQKNRTTIDAEPERALVPASLLLVRIRRFPILEALAALQQEHAGLDLARMNPYLGPRRVC